MKRGTARKISFFTTLNHMKKVNVTINIELKNEVKKNIINILICVLVLKHSVSVTSRHKKLVRPFF